MSASLLIQIAVKVSIVLAMAWLATRAMRRSSAAARHFVWTIAILAVLLVPVMVLVGPAWQLRVLPAPTARTEAQPARETLDFRVLNSTSDRFSSVLAGSQPRPSTGRAEPVEARSLVLGAAVEAALPSGGDPRALNPETRARTNWQSLLLSIWAAGGAFVLLRLGIGIVWVGWIARGAERITDAAWLTILEEVAATLRLKGRISLGRTDRTTVPVACGLWRPTLLMPIDADDWSAERRRVVLLHELAHVKRQDCRLQAIAQIAYAWHWFNPLAHVAVAGLRAEQERACDDLVLAAGTDGPAYADHLFEIAKAFRSAAVPGWAMLAMAAPSQLEGRVLAILDAEQCRHAPSRLIRVMAAVVVAAAVLPLGAFRLSAASGVLAAVESGTVESGTVEGDTQVADTHVLVEPTLLEPPFEAIIQEPPADTAQTDQALLVTQDFDLRGINPWVDVQIEPPFDIDPNFDFDFHFEPPFGIDPNPDPDPNPDLDFRFDLKLDHLGPNLMGLVGAQPQAAGDGVQDETRRRVADALSLALNDENERVREQAIQGLAAMRDPRAVPALIKALQSRDARLRQIAVGSLSQFDTPEAAQGLIAALKDENVNVRRQAVSALGRRRDPKYTDAISSAMRDQDPRVRAQAVAALARVRDSGAVVGPLVQALKDSNADVRARAAASLASLRSTEAVPGLIAALKDADADVRRMSAVALGAIADPRAIDALTATLKDMDPAVREHAARALGSIARGQRRGPGRVPVADLDFKRFNREIAKVQAEVAKAQIDFGKVESLDAREMVDAAMREADKMWKKFEKNWPQVEQQPNPLSRPAPKGR